VSCPRRP